MSVGLLARVWMVPVALSAVAIGWSWHVGIPMRDPSGSLFAMRFALSLGLFAIALAAQRLVHRGRWRWHRRNIGIAVAGFAAYHVTYVAYRNLKNLVGLRAIHDSALRDLDRAAFGGHDPAVLLHHALGEHATAHLLALVYRSFAMLVPLSIVLSVALLPRLRDGLTYLTCGMWCWVLGTASYYLVPSRGPFAEMPGDFAGLSPTAITATQHHYLFERARFLAHPTATDTLNSISAFASLHVGFTTMIVLFARHLGLRRTTRVLWAYLGCVIVSTIYFGWHFVSDDVAGFILGWGAVRLGLWTIDGHLPVVARWIPVPVEGRVNP